MEKNKFLFIFTLGVTSLVIGVTAYQSSSVSKGFFASKGNTTHTLILDSSNAISSLTDSYQNNVSGTVTTSNGNSVTMSFTNAKRNDGGFITLANHGKIYNYASNDDQLTGVDGISFTGSGSLLFKPCTYQNILSELDPILVSANAEMVAVPNCDYFEIEAGDSGASITNMNLHYSCNPDGYDASILKGTYTGIGGGYTYKLTISGDSTAIIETLDKDSNDVYNGHISMSSKTSVTFSDSTLTYNMSFSNGYILTGTASGNVPAITFTRVFKVEDFESYSASGQGYTSSTTKYQTTGLRSQYYADYYTGSSSGEIGGSGWPVMTSTDNSNYSSNRGRNSSAGGIFKFSNGTSMRYVSMNLLYGVNRLIGKGTTLSFWARGAYSKSDYSSNNSANIPMKVYAFYGTPVTSSNLTSVRETYDFTVNSGTTWQHFEMPLTDGRNYYGFGMYAQQSSGSTAYVPFDDFEIYTSSPYAEYVPVTSVTGVELNKTSKTLDTGDKYQLTANVLPANATNKDVTWTSNNTSVATVDSNGLVTTITTGNATITATTVDGGLTATCVITVVAPGAYPSGTFKASINMIVATINLVISIGTRANELVAVNLSNTDALPTGISFDDSTKQITIPTTGTFVHSDTTYDYGVITGTYDKTNNRITNVNCTGSVGEFVSNKTVTVANTSTSSFFNNCDGNTSSLQSTFKRRYMSGSWQVDTSSDRITSNTTEYVSGGALKLKGYGSGAVALNLNSDFSSTKSITNVHFWVYNPSNKDITLRMWYYTAKNLNSNAETGSVIAKAGQWTYCSMGFGKHNIYNFQIADFTNSGVSLTIDNYYLFS